MNLDQDPRDMDGRAIAAKLHKLTREDGPQWEFTMWTGIAVGRLLEYQDKLEAAGLLAPRAPTGPASNPEGS